MLFDLLLFKYFLCGYLTDCIFIAVFFFVFVFFFCILTFCPLLVGGCLWDFKVVPLWCNFMICSLSSFKMCMIFCSLLVLKVLQCPLFDALYKCMLLLLLLELWLVKSKILLVTKTKIYFFIGFLLTLPITENTSLIKET